MHRRLICDVVLLLERHAKFCQAKFRTLVTDYIAVLLSDYSTALLLQEQDAERFAL